jgi:LysR family nitrogen assimilation transcriptional regulator
MLPDPSDADHLRSVITLGQIDTFLTVIEQGSVVRAAGKLGVGRSTVSAHSKLIADETGHPLFHRSQGALGVSDAGLNAYNRFRSVAAHAGFCMNYFRRRQEAAASFVPVLLPSGFPGSLLDRALEWVSRRLAAARPEICLLPSYINGSVTPDDLGFAHVTRATDGCNVGDRWLLVRAATKCPRGVPVRLADLRSLKIHVPRLPAALSACLSDLAEQAGISLERSDAGLQEIVGLLAQSQNFCVLLPASLFSPVLADDQIECLQVESSAFDPVVVINDTEFPAIAELLQEELSALIDGRRTAAEAMPHERSDNALSLKHCRSFLALYEEGNVGRAAQRLSIVQPALTVQLHRIEEQAGCRLFNRSCHGLRANARADSLYGLLRPLVSSFDTTLRHLRASADKRATPIRVGLIPALDEESLMSESFAAALDKWSRSYPENVLQVREGYSGALLRWLHSGTVDFALVDQFFTDPALIVESIVEDSMAVVVSSTSGLLAPGAVTLAELASLPLVLPSSRHGLRSLLAQTLFSRGLELQPRIEVDSMAGCLNMVKIARYATILPMGSVYKSRERRGLSVHEIKDPRIVRTICVARARNKPHGDAEMAFLDELRLAFAGPAERCNGAASVPPGPLVGALPTRDFQRFL